MYLIDIFLCKYILYRIHFEQLIATEKEMEALFILLNTTIQVNKKYKSHFFQTAHLQDVHLQSVHEHAEPQLVFS